MAVYDTDDYAHTPEHTTSVYDSRTVVQNPAVQSRSLKVLQRSLLLEYVYVHVYSQRVQKYTESSRTQNVKKKPCLH